MLSQFSPPDFPAGNLSNTNRCSIFTKQEVNTQVQQTWLAIGSGALKDGGFYRDHQKC